MGAGITGTGGETSGLTGTARDEWQELFFLDGRYIFATLPVAVAMTAPSIRLSHESQLTIYTGPSQSVT